MTRTCAACSHEGEPDGIRCSNCFSRFDDATREQVTEYYSRWTVSDPDDPIYVSFEEFYEIVEMVYDRCERGARSRTTIAYSDALEDVFSTRGIYALFTIGSIEYREGRQLLTSVVADEGDIPGAEYFQLAASLGAGPSELPDWEEADKRSWWGAELQRVFDVWEDVPDPSE